jgi:hypothetical protein
MSIQIYKRMVLWFLSVARSTQVLVVANMPRYGLLFAGSYSYSAGQVTEGFRRIRRLSDGLTQGRLVSFSCLYMTRLVLHFLGSKLSSASINHMTNTWVLRATLVM